MDQRGAVNIAEIKLLDADDLKNALRVEAALGYIHTLQDVERVIDARPLVRLRPVSPELLK